MSQFLGISEPALSQWVNDRTVPRVDLLRMAIDLLTTRGGVGAGEALMALEAIWTAFRENLADRIPVCANLRSYLRVRSLAEIGRSMRDQAADEVTELDNARVPHQPLRSTSLRRQLRSMCPRPAPMGSAPHGACRGSSPQAVHIAACAGIGGRVRLWVPHRPGRNCWLRKDGLP